jgi:hypothetical protein
MDKKVKETFITREHIQDIYLAGSKEQFRTLSLHLLSLLEEEERAHENCIKTADLLRKIIEEKKVKVREFERKQKWIDEVARPSHPDDERPWAAAYLGCRELIRKLVYGIEDALGESTISYTVEKILRNLVKKEG